MKKFTKSALTVLAAVFMFHGAAAADPFSNFKTGVQDSFIKPFARDLGGLIGGSDFSSGRTAGFPGFDVGLSAVVQARPSDSNRILRSANVKAFGLPLLQACAGLPVVGADLAVRGMSYSSLSIIGGGLRYPLLKSGTLTKFIPDVAVSAFYDSIKYTYFKGSHMSFDLSASFDIPVIKPYAGLGYDRTKIEVTGVPTAALNGASAVETGTRYTLGLRVTPFPMTYVFGAYSVLHGAAGYQAGFGVKF
ncbi:MAG: DUF6588 family protein [Elusimicrobiales bacterium]|jgi:hypothetical protein